MVCLCVFLKTEQIQAQIKIEREKNHFKLVFCKASEQTKKQQSFTESLAKIRIRNCKFTL